MLNDLPDELILHILGALVVWKDDSLGDGPPLLEQAGLQGLARICSTCRHLRDLAEPLLYQNYSKPVVVLQSETSHDDDDDHIHDFNNSDNIFGSPGGERAILTVKPNTGLRRFLRTLIERPDLAAYVERISLSQWETVDSLASQRLKTQPAETEDARRYYMAISRLLLGCMSHDWVTGWLYCLSEGIEDAEVALLLALTPNVEDLVIEWAPFRSNRPRLFLRKIWQSAIGERLHLYSLKGLHTFTPLKQLRVLVRPAQEDAVSMLGAMPELLGLPNIVLENGAC